MSFFAKCGDSSKLSFNNFSILPTVFSQLNSSNSLFQALFLNFLSILCPVSVTFPVGFQLYSILFSACKRKEKKTPTNAATFLLSQGTVKATFSLSVRPTVQVISWIQPSSSCRSRHPGDHLMFLYNLHNRLFVHPVSHCSQNSLLGPTQSCFIHIFSALGFKTLLKSLFWPFKFIFPKTL